MISVSLPLASLAPAHNCHCYEFPKRTMHVSHPRHWTHRRPTVGNRYAAFEVDENFSDSTHCIFEPTVLDVVPNAEVGTLSKRQKSRRKAKKGNQRFTGNQMLGKPLRNFKISEGGMSEKSKPLKLVSEVPSTHIE